MKRYEGILRQAKGIMKVSAVSVKYTLRSSLAVVLCNRTPTCMFHPATHLSFSAMLARAYQQQTCPLWRHDNHIGGKVMLCFILLVCSRQQPPSTIP
jgi:hypothetical protein